MMLKASRYVAVWLCALATIPSVLMAEPYKIGVPVPLTGALEAYGHDIQRGFEIGKELLGAQDVELVFEDDACDPATSVTVTKKLLEVNKILVMSGMYCNGALFAAAPILNQAKIPTITVGANTGDTSGIGPKIFRIFPGDQLALKPLFPHMTKVGKRLCLITETDAFTALIERTVMSQWPAHGADFTIVAEAVNTGERDFRGVLLRLLRRGCDILQINAQGDDASLTA